MFFLKHATESSFLISIELVSLYSQSSVIGKLWDCSLLQVGKTYAFKIWLLLYFQGK